MKRSIAIVLLGAPAVLGFAPSSPLLSHPSSALSMGKARGRGSISGGGGGSGNKLNKPTSIDNNSSESAPTSSNWAQTSIPSIASLPKDANVVKLVDTNVPALVDKGTNPTGAVSIVNYEDGTTYCFSSSCGSCKIPLSKATVLDPTEETGDDARLQCDLCGATYNLRTGSPVTKEGGKMLGFLFGKSDDVPLPVYGLGEKGGKVFISVP